MSAPRIRSSAASEFEHTPCIRFCLSNKFVKMLGRSLAIAHYGVVEPTKNLIAWHMSWLDWIWRYREVFKCRTRRFANVAIANVVTRAFPLKIGESV